MSRELLHNLGAVTKVIFARLRFLSVFLIAALLFGYWDNIKNHWDKWTRPPAAAHDDSIEYSCKMHPWVVRDGPGDCPICGMPLGPRKKGDAIAVPENVLARVQLSPQRVALAGIETTKVERRMLVRQIHTLGVLDYNETKIARLSAWVAGRADQLFVQYVGQAVTKGDPVYSLYSPDVYTALREYLVSRQRVNELPKDAAADTRADAAAVYNASLQKLVLWGISQPQLDQADHEYDQTGKIPTHLIVTSPISGIVVTKDIFEGAYVNVGEKPYTIADLGTLWLQLKLYERDVPLVQVGSPVDVTVEAMPNEVFHGAVTFRAFQLDPQTRTLDARVEVANPGLRLRPGMYADASIAVPIGAPATTAPVASTPSTRPADPLPEAFASALASYLEAQKLLTQDKSDGVVALLDQSVKALDPVAKDSRIAPQVEKLLAATQKTKGQDLPAIRDTFMEISDAMIAIGKVAHLPADARAISVFRCPMKKANWLQTPGGTLNPYYGSSMLDCGAAVEALPREESSPAATTQAATQPASAMLAIPRSAVIEAGRNRIVYVESSSGVFDMRAVGLGPAAGEFYPVIGGLNEGEKVVTIGAFLVDSENRLNPLPTTRP